MFFIISVPTTNYKNAQKVCIPLKSCAAIKRKKPQKRCSWGLWSEWRGLERAASTSQMWRPTQLGYTRIFNFYHYTTAEGKIKDFSVCGHSCGQNPLFMPLCDNREKSRNHRCHKALRRFALPCPG